MQTSVERVRMWAQLARTVIALSAIVFSGFIAWAGFEAWRDPAWVGGWVEATYPEVRGLKFSSFQGSLLAIVYLPQIVSFLWAAFGTWRAFGLIAARDGLSFEASIWLRRAGIGFAFTALAMLLSHPLISAIASLGLPEGHKFITISVGTPELMTLLVSFMMFVLAHVMTLAIDIDRDNKLIV